MMKKYDMKLNIATIATLVCLVPVAVTAQIGNPWNPSLEASITSKFPAPSPQILTVQAEAQSRYAPADLEQRLSAIKPALPIAPPAVPQPSANAQPYQYPAPQQYNAPMANNYQGNAYPPAYGYGVPPQGYNGYPQNNGSGAYNNNGIGMPFSSGRYPRNSGGFTPSTGMFPGGGGTPFNMSPFGFF